MLNKTIYKRTGNEYTVALSKKGKPIGRIVKEGHDWVCYIKGSIKDIPINTMISLRNKLDTLQMERN